MGEDVLSTLSPLHLTNNGQGCGGGQNYLRASCFFFKKGMTVSAQCERIPGIFGRQKQLPGFDLPQDLRTLGSRRSPVAAEATAASGKPCSQSTAPGRRVGPGRALSRAGQSCSSCSFLDSVLMGPASGGEGSVPARMYSTVPFQKLLLMSSGLVGDPGLAEVWRVVSTEPRQARREDEHSPFSEKGLVSSCSLCVSYRVKTASFEACL